MPQINEVLVLMAVTCLEETQEFIELKHQPLLNAVFSAIYFEPNLLVLMFRRLGSRTLR